MRISVSYCQKVCRFIKYQLKKQKVLYLIIFQLELNMI